MHVCFHGGAGDSKITKSVSIIRGFTKNMKAMSLKVKVGGGGNHARARRRRRPEADNTVQDYKDVAAAAAAASASAKIAPAQLQEEADDDHQLHNEEEEEEQGGGKKQEYCDKCCSPLLDDGGGGGAKEETAAAAIVKAKEVAEESGREWVSEPEPGVVMTLAPRSDGTNRLRRIRFREALFDAWTAQSWWADNYDRVVELYSVVQSDEEEEEEEAAAAAVPVTPCHSEEGEELPDGMTGAEDSGSPWTSNFTGGSGSGGGSSGTVGSPILGLVTAPNTSGNGSTTTRAAQHDSTCQQPTTAWREWVEEYEAGVFITVRAYPDHHLQLRHVELSRERFGEVKARVWWQENKARLHHLYSF